MAWGGRRGGGRPVSNLTGGGSRTRTVVKSRQTTLIAHQRLWRLESRERLGTNLQYNRWMCWFNRKCSARSFNCLADYCGETRKSLVEGTPSVPLFKDWIDTTVTWTIEREVQWCKPLPDFASSRSNSQRPPSWLSSMACIKEPTPMQLRIRASESFREAALKTLNWPKSDVLFFRFTFHVDTRVLWVFSQGYQAVHLKKSYSSLIGGSILSWRWLSWHSPSAL